MIGPRAAALLGALLVVWHASPAAADNPTITLNFMECAKASNWTPPVDVITCTASVTVSELPLDSYTIDYSLGHFESDFTFKPKHLTTYNTWNTTGSSVVGSAHAWYKASDGSIIRSNDIPISPYASPPPPHPVPPPISPPPPAPSPPPPAKIAIDSALCRKAYYQEVACTVEMTFLELPSEVWLIFDMVGGPKSERREYTNSLKMTYKTLVSGVSSSGTVTASVMYHGVVMSVGPYPIGDSSISPPPPPPIPPPSPPPPFPFALSNAMCEQQEPKLYNCQVQVTIGSLLALITVNYDVGGVTATQTYAPDDLITISTITRTPIKSHPQSVGHPVHPVIVFSVVSSRAFY
ncbi:hypothetical protein ACKKBG_A11255 [Auxenochlorella protothecoides x Auxenochlorella symbiontica]